MIKISGYSDDVIVVEHIIGNKTAEEDEFDSYDKDTLFEFDDGTVLRMHYDGTWKAITEKRGPAFSNTTALVNEDDYYSDEFSIDTNVIKKRWKERI